MNTWKNRRTTTSSHKTLTNFAMHILVTFTIRNHTPSFRNVLTPDVESSLRTSDRRVLRVDTELLDKRAPLRGSTFTRTSIVT